MKRILYLIFFINLLINNSFAEIAYIDMNYLLNKSEVGKSLNAYIDEMRNKKQIELKELEDKLIKKEKLLISQQNILNKDEFEKKLNILSVEVNEYRSDKNSFKEELNNIKINNSKKILQILNPIITKYVEENSISLVLPKKNIIVGKKNLEITDKIIKLLNEKVKSLNF